MQGRSRVQGPGAPAPAVALLLLLLLLTASQALGFGFDLNLPPDQQPGAEIDYGDLLVAPLSLEGRREPGRGLPPRLPTPKRRRLSEGPSETPGETNSQTPAKEPSRAQSLWSKVRHLPSYFNFSNFMSEHKRHYGEAQRSTRKLIFISRCMEILKERVAYRLGEKTYLEGVNKFSDLTKDEFRLMYSAIPPDGGAGGALEPEEVERLAERRLAELRKVANADYLPEFESQSSRDGTGTTAGLLSEAQAKSQLEGLAAGSPEFERALLDELGEFDIEEVSQAAPGGLERRPLPWPGHLSAPPDPSGPREPYESASLEEGLDWGRHECFHSIYDQGRGCGRCYVIAATSLAEFYKCSEARENSVQRKFSKDYVIACGQKFSPGVQGCVGGSVYQALRFIAFAGIYNIKDWRETRRSTIIELRRLGHWLEPFDMSCPLSQAMRPIAEWGHERVTLNPRQIEPSEFLEALQDGPLAVTVRMPPNGFDSYKSGVHDGAGCATSSAWHVMVLVGYGTNERGQAYWRFRNSFGIDWGDRGHFNLAMDVPDKCFGDAVRLIREPLD